MFRPLEAETLFKIPYIIKIPYISCNKLFSNSCLVVNLNYYKFVVLDVHTLLFSIQVQAQRWSEGVAVSILNLRVSWGCGKR